ncbi:carbohydrate ABC transporter permease [Halococcus sp. IIIV-5B]|uniref:carbohydrate ABC transporter permease n=1 Tax=Halococcus sp. IIIV-5B TaxID=2321230 RepID=UPI0018F5EE35|nr:sugar ABC transporter permease [Halococcus sp. IIIV-5B]
MAFQEVSLLQPNEVMWVGLQNITEMLDTPEFWDAFSNTVVIATAAVSLEYIFGLGLALALKQKLPGITFFRNVSLVTWVMPIIVMTIIFRFIMQPEYGLVNIILSFFNIDTTYWFGDPTWAKPLIVVMHMWRNIPFTAVALMAAMQSIPTSLYEAAELDGAGKLEQFRYITLPNITYVSMIMIVLHTIFTVNDFEIIYLTTGGGPLGSTEVLATYVYKLAFNEYTLGFAASIGLTMLIILLAFTFIYVQLEDIE